MDEQQARLRDLARVFLKIGAMSYGGPAIMGIMQNEIQERRRWLGKERFVEGLSIVNMLPGPGATQLAIFIGHTKGGLAGGIVAGICFIIPAFAIMLLLASAYAAFGALPALRNASLYLPISAIAALVSGVDGRPFSLSAVAFTKTITRIGCLPG